MRSAGLLLFQLIVVVAPASVSAQSAENVALVINTASPASERIGEHYIRARAIPSDNVIRIRTSTEDTIDRAAYGSGIEEPIAAAIRRQGLHDRILYIVLTKGVPLRISGTDGLEGTVASVDSELTLLYRRMTGQRVPVAGRVPNPYYVATAPVREAPRFSHRTHDIFLVSRLDAFTEDEAIALIDRAQQPVRDGTIVLDQRAALLSDSIGDRWLAEAARRLTDGGAGERVMLEQTTTGARDVDGVLGYYSWGSNDPGNRVRRYGMRFVPGSVAATFVSSDGRTFQNPPDGWEASSDWNNRKTWFAGSPQSLVGDLIREGATGVAGHVAEPYLQSTVRPEILFPAYLAGFNLIEAFYMALPHLSWQAVVVGDPLCQPFERPNLTRAEIEEPNDTSTQLPGLFSKRRLESARVGARNTDPKAIAFAVLAETLQGRGDDAGARKALEDATALAPGFTASHLTLAISYAASGEHEKSIERYRILLKLQPNNLVVLNNLAYALAMHQKQPVEALPLAKRAVAMAPTNASVLDTLGWVQHLTGDHKAAAKVLSQAIRLAPTNGEIRLHAAIVYAELGDLTQAGTELSEALRLDPELGKRDEVSRLQARMKKK